ncbi:MAG: 50S ribosomal protein L30 [Gammaproteobacteria bacterium]|nr:MAG: 50S ribosomal protein L30 [Gammaproteobacteria bacterium]
MAARKKTKRTSKKLQVTLVRSMHGRVPGHMECVRGLGLRRREHCVEVADTLENRGMINKVSYLLHVEEV